MSHLNKDEQKERDELHEKIKVAVNEEVSGNQDFAQLMKQLDERSFEDTK